MKRIPLTQGKVAIIDDKDLALVSQYEWFAHKNGKNFYAETRLPISKGRILLKMHVLIMGKKIGFEIDHINHNGIDNRRENLRHATHSQNHQNNRPRIHCSSKYKGVYWHKRDKKWEVQIGLDGALFYLGRFASEQEAAILYNKSAVKMFGPFAFLNKVPA